MSAVQTEMTSQKNGPPHASVLFNLCRIWTVYIYSNVGYLSISRNGGWRPNSFRRCLHQKISELALLHLVGNIQTSHNVIVWTNPSKFSELTVGMPFWLLCIWMRCKAVYTPALAHAHNPSSFSTIFADSSPYATLASHQYPPCHWSPTKPPPLMHQRV